MTGRAVGCVQCHNSSSEDGGFTGGNAGGLHVLHLTSFGITSCALCHSSSAGGSKPVLTYYSGDGYGCAGCHGRDQGETSIHSGKPKSSGYGLRKVHATAGITVCASCHFPGSSITGDPSPAPTIVAETVQPPYYLLSNNNLTDPCSAAQEGFEGTVGLDNDGNGSRDANDPACKARTTTPGPKPTATATPTPGKPKKNIKVKPGESIQAAVDAVAEGGTVSVLPGTYEETHDGTTAVRITKNGIKLIGKSHEDEEGHPGAARGAGQRDRRRARRRRPADQRRQNPGLHRAGLPEQRYLHPLRGQLHDPEERVDRQPGERHLADPVRERAGEE